MDMNAGNISLEEKRSLYLNKWKQLKMQGKNQRTEKEILVSKISSAQKRIWLHEQVANNIGGLYCVPVALRIKKKLDINLLSSAWNQVANRHTLLKSVFYQDGEEVYFKIIPDMQMEPQYVPMMGKSKKEIDQFLTEKTEIPFDLKTGPNIRMYLIDTEFGNILFLNMHHIIVDGWSIGILIKDILEEYDRAYHQLPESGNEVLSYAAYIQKSKEEHRSEKQELEANDFWKQEIGEIRNLDLVTDYKRPTVQEFTGSKEAIQIPQEMMNSIEAICKEKGYTLFHVMSGALYGLLQRYSQQDEFAIGVPFANRNQMDAENMIGLFVNTVPLKFNYGSSIKFIDLLSKIDEKMQMIMQYQVPFEELVTRYVKNRDLAYSPIFQVMFDMQTVFHTDGQAEYGIEYQSVNTGLTLFDLLFNVIQIDDKTMIELTYCNKIFTSDTAKQFLMDYQTVLEQLVLHFEDSLSAALEKIEPRRAVICIQSKAIKLEHAEDIQLILEKMNIPARVKCVEELQQGTTELPLLVVSEEEEDVENGWFPVYCPVGAANKECMVVKEVINQIISCLEDKSETDNTVHGWTEDVERTTLYQIVKRLLETAEKKEDFAAQWRMFQECPEGFLKKEEKSKNGEQEIISKTEERLLRIWRGELSSDQIGVNDSFFQLGGNSINAIGILAKIQKEFQRELSVRILMEHSTVRKLAAFMEQSSKDSQKKVIKIERIEDQINIPLTDTQKAVYFLCKMEKDVPLYNIPGAIEIEGELNVSILNEVILNLFKRHESLRTRFVQWEQNIYQEVTEISQYTLPIIDISNLNEAEKEKEQQVLLYKESQYLFDFNEENLIRFLLIKKEESRFILSITMHHMISDGWSLRVLERDMTELYNSLLDKRKANLPEINVRYRDYAYWYENRRDGLERQIQFWKSELQSAEPFEIPTDFSRGKKNYSGSTYYKKIKKDIVTMLRTKANKLSVTEFSALLSAFQLLMSSLSGKNQTLLGIPVANRNQTGVQNTVGFFTNVLALKLDISGNIGIDQFILKINEKLNNVFENQNVLFETLSKQMDLPDYFIHICFNYLNMPLSTMEFHHIRAKVLDIARDSSKYDIDFFIRDEGDEMLISIEYNTVLYRKESIEYLANAYLELLNHIITEENTKIFDIRKHCLDLIEKKSAVKVSGMEAFHKRNILEQFFQIANQYPTKIAVTTICNSLTYQELSDCVKRAGMYLRKKTSTGRIAIMANQDISMIKCMFAVLASGNTYIPLDVNYPKERIEYILKDSEVDVILGEQDIFNVLKNDNFTVPYVTIEEAETCTEDYVSITESRLAYILYTSGSTGKPKGVMQENAHVCGHIANYTRSLGITEQDFMLDLASYCFDASVMDIYGALLNGASLFVYDIKRDGFVKLYEVMNNGKITIYHSTPTVYRRVFENLPAVLDTSKIRVFVLGGEEVKKSDYELFEHISTESAVLINGLGPTECTLAFQKHLGKGEKMAYSTIPIGYPVDHIMVQLLDENGNEGTLCGEMELIGQNIAVGYLNSPEKNGVFSYLEDKKICYRTGDHARMLPNGEYIYIGRKDFQVKIRGIRIELSEIEHALKAHKAIKDAKVVQKGEAYLGAYIVCKKGEILPESEIYTYLTGKLPKYMIPEYIEILEEFPMTLSGKIDVQTLIKKEHKNVKQDDNIIEATTEKEKALVQIWEKILHIEQIGVNQNFFDVGGNSLLILVMQNEILETLSVDIPIINLYQTPTIRDIAQFVEKHNEILDEDVSLHKETEREKVANRNQMRKISRERRR